MANCTVTFQTSAAARSNTVFYQALPGQIVGGVAIDTARITATASGNNYIATLIQGGRYQLISDRFPFASDLFTCPATGTANLVDLLDGAARNG